MSPSPAKPGKSLMMELEETDNFGDDMFAARHNLGISSGPTFGPAKSAFICLTPTALKRDTNSAFFPEELVHSRRVALVRSGVIEHDNLAPGVLVIRQLESEFSEPPETEDEV